ncbi:hypothetical protein KS4_31500 [Poriferisphaera corsica]|uniref:Ice-binding protein C-terminal domain-containing protein n=1 Tax=Poriferisphaera corsica TaxID=2528020 RepID=A0A517YXW8_9BACT|nr:PEP-CTERM sorting domain-containing protein [Poriferisphaera corsica]QDU35072.1 hypothetical protein KS4_31500 [Poriferisphaera corsica]
MSRLRLILPIALCLLISAYLYAQPDNVNISQISQLPSETVEFDHAQYPINPHLIDPAVDPPAPTASSNRTFVPEPGSLILILLGTLAIARRRKDNH